MYFIENSLYHIYNQGNNRELIFKENSDFRRFEQKTRILIAPYCNIIAYCLMPNHYHFLVQSNKKSIITKQLGSLISNNLSNGFRLLQSEYAQEYNAKYDRSGSLFRQKTKSKCLTDNNSDDYAFICFHYIHQNPYEANLVNRLEEWEFSSFKHYHQPTKDSFCKTQLAFDLIGISKEDFYNESYSLVNKKQIEKIY